MAVRLGRSCRRRDRERRLPRTGHAADLGPLLDPRRLQLLDPAGLRLRPVPDDEVDLLFDEDVDVAGAHPVEGTDADADRDAGGDDDDKIEDYEEWRDDYDDQIAYFDKWDKVC